MFEKKKQVSLIAVDFVGLEKTVKIISYLKGISNSENNAIYKMFSKMEPKVQAANVENIKRFDDFGLSGRCGEDLILFGNAKFMEKNNITLHGELTDRMFLAINKEVQAVFVLGERYDN